MHASRAWDVFSRNWRDIIDPNSGDEDTRRMSRILNILLLALFGTSGLFFIEAVVEWVMNPPGYDGIPLLVLGASSAVFLGLLWLSRRGARTAASLGLLAAVFLPVAWTMVSWGADLPEAIVSLALLILVSGILLGDRIAAGAAVAATAAILGLTAAQISGHFAPDVTWRSEPIAFDHVPPKGILFAAIAAVTWLSNREMERSLQRARRSEQELLAQKDVLEQEVTRRVQELREAQLERLAAYERFAEFGKLASGILHDLANPLTAASLNLEMLHAGDRPQKEPLRQASDALHRVTRFLEAAQRRYRGLGTPSAFDPREEAEAVLTILSHRARSAGITLAQELPPAGKAIGDPVAFGQILLNLVTNAIDACEHIPGTGPHVNVRVTNSPTGLSIDVEDRGVGIPAHAKIFEAFYTTKTPEHGTGIGLATVKNLVQRWNGSISFRPRTGGGTIFHVELPHLSPPASG
jgi:signal transduction histidine kinase